MGNTTKRKNLIQELQDNFSSFNREIEKTLLDESTVDFSQSVLKNLDLYKKEGKLSPQIYHWIKKEKIVKEKSYKIYVNMSMTLDFPRIVAIGGWIANEKNEVLLEFSENMKNIDESYINAIEKNAVIYAMDIMKELNIKKYNLYTSSYSVPFILYKNQEFIKRGLSITKEYELIEHRLKENKNNINIYSTPKNYNTHSDKLAKLYVNELKEQNNKEIEELRNLGHVQLEDIDDEQYFIHQHVKNKDSYSENEEILVMEYSPTHKAYRNYFINATTHKITPLSMNSLSYMKAYVESYDFSSEEAINRTINNWGTVYNMLAVLEKLQDTHPNLTLAYPNKGIEAVLKNIVKVKENRLEEYLHIFDIADEFKQLNFVSLSPELTITAKNFYQENASSILKRKK